jgi:WD40 repeat protein
MKHLMICIMLGIVVGMYTLAFADEPILVIDPQGHSSVIWDLMFTPDGKTLVSVAEDKTIRVWDVETGDLIKTVRGQIDQEYDGKFYAGALSPDGKILAVGGLLGASDNYGNIRLINLETGEQMALLKGHTSVVADLTFSQDGKWLASGSGDYTIKIWDLSPLLSGVRSTNSPRPLGEGQGVRELATLEGHTNIVYSVDFSPDGTKLVSGAYDGTVRLWKLPEDFSQFVRSKRMKKHTDGLHSVVFSPDGNYIVSGGLDGKILLWDAEGEFLKEIDEIPYGAFTISFSADSTRIVVGGAGPKNVHLYEIPSGEKIGMFTKHDNSVHPSAFYGNEWIATAGGNDHDIYIWDTSSGSVKTHIVGKGKMVWPVALGQTQDEGLNVAFGNNWEGNLVKTFDFSDMSINLQPPVEPDFKFAQTKYGEKTLQQTSEYELQVTNSGTIATQRDREGRILSYTFTHDGNVVVGTDYTLRLYQDDGTALREFIGHTVHIWAVAISEDGRILVSAADDKTIKLWNLETAECLATLFVARDHEWICWMPQGYYAASAGGEKYIGWHLNWGDDKAAEYYPVSIFRKQFYHPELVKRTIAVGSFEQALQEFHAEPQQKLEETTVTQVLPPKVQWVLPETGIIETSEASIRIHTKIQSESKLTAAKVLVNGRTQATERGLAMSGGGVEVENVIDQEIPLVPGKNEITIFAANENAGATSTKRIVVYQGKEHIPNLYVVAIGISQYHKSDLQLEYADDDAKAIGDLFRSQAGVLYNDVILKELYDTDATQANIIQAIEWLKQHATQKDVVIIFIAAHGSNAQGKYYLLPADGIPDELHDTGVSWSVFSEALGNLPSKVLLFLDTCHSGQLGQDVQVKSKQVDNTEALRELSSDEYGVVILAASTGKEFSLEHADWGHGAFTKALLEALGQGQADYSKDGLIHLRELDLYVAERVETLTNNQQHPTTQKPSTISRFPIVQVITSDE